MIRASEEWPGLLGARHLVGCSVQDLVELPVLLNAESPRRGRRRSALARRARLGLDRNRLGVVVRTRGLIVQQRIAADNQPAVASLRGLLGALPLNANVGRTKIGDRLLRPTRGASIAEAPGLRVAPRAGRSGAWPSPT